MKAVTQIKEYISQLPAGQPFPSSALRQLASTDNIRQILNRLVKAGEIKRIGRGIFVKPEQVTAIGEVLPSVIEIAQTLAKSTGEIIAVHGAEAARQLQLSTQVPVRLIFYTSGNTRTLKLANRTVKLKHAAPSRLVACGTTAGLVICALEYLGRENVTLEIITNIKHHITAEEFQTVQRLVEYMPTWLSDIFYRYQQGLANE